MQGIVRPTSDSYRIVKVIYEHLKEKIAETPWVATNILNSILELPEESQSPEAKDIARICIDSLLNMKSDIFTPVGYQIRLKPYKII